jgi:hypothetical protein
MQIKSRLEALRILVPGEQIWKLLLSVMQTSLTAMGRIATWNTIGQLRLQAVCTLP